MTLSDKIMDKEYNTIKNILWVKDVKEFIKKFERFLIKKYAEEKTTHKNHRVQSLLVELRQELFELAGDKLINCPQTKPQDGKATINEDKDPEETETYRNGNNSGSDICKNCGHDEKLHPQIKNVTFCQADNCKCKKFEPEKVGCDIRITNLNDPLVKCGYTINGEIILCPKCSGEGK